ncbi:MAG: hypothetical protein IKC75_07390 [Clostridia bacterium]|nr:hypothetical protein [Clostridia bacterium]
MKKEKRMGRLRPIVDQIKQDKKAYAVYVILSVLILTVMVRSVFLRRFENVFTAVLAGVLLLIPPVVERSFHIELPTTLEIFAYVFVFCAEILGEIGNFYMHFPFWDTMLHTFNGFMFAAFGFCLLDIFNKTKRFRFQLSPFSLALVAFCFSMTIGVLWEFFEFGADMILNTDMQKDTFVRIINSVSIENALGEKVTHIKDVITTVIVTESGEVVTLNGYLDIGLIDIVKDLFVNFVGAVIFSVIGYFYVKRRGKGPIAKQFIPVFTGETEPHDRGEQTDD